MPLPLRRIVSVRAPYSGSVLRAGAGARMAAALAVSLVAWALTGWALGWWP